MVGTVAVVDVVKGPLTSDGQLASKSGRSTDS